MSYLFWLKFTIRKTSFSSKIRHSVLEVAQNLDQEFLYVVELLYVFIFGFIFIIDSYIIFPGIWSSLSVINSSVLSIIMIIADLILCYFFARFFASAMGAFILKAKYDKK